MLGLWLVSTITSSGFALRRSCRNDVLLSKKTTPPIFSELFVFSQQLEICADAYGFMLQTWWTAHLSHVKHETSNFPEMFPKSCGSNNVINQPRLGMVPPSWTRWWLGEGLVICWKIPSPVHTKHPLNHPNGMWKFPTSTMVSLRGCLVWRGDGITHIYPTGPVLESRLQAETTTVHRGTKGTLPPPPDRTWDCPWGGRWWKRNTYR